MLLAAYPVFLIIAVCSAAEMSTAHVEPPTNVTFHCHNMHNVLKWSYGEMVPGLRFRIDIEPYYSVSNEEKNQLKPQWVEPPTLQADLSQLWNPSEDYFVYVSAVVGGNKSAEAPPDWISFSYYHSTKSTYKCFLDFPPVNVSVEEERLVHIHFVHPWILYGGSLPNKSAKTDLPKFEYKVELISQNTTHDPTCESRLCSAKLQVHTAQETHCVKVNGNMKDISVKGIHTFCNERPKGPPIKINYTIIAIVIAALISFFGLVFISCMVYRKKTRPSTHLPNTLAFSERLKQTLGLTPEHVSVLKVDPFSPTPLLDKDSNTPESIVVTPESAPDDLDIRLPIGLSCENADEEVRAEDNDEGLPAVYLTGKELEDEDEDEDEDEAGSCGGSSAGYEKRTVQLAQDETLEGYRCRRSGENE
ncbi:growth/differentiation factor 10b [Nelusetta ayraudi]|uniref:growth/differentiation factor 10b n=1 Tax=Nelusetta ayraudi TaxID=303726 RepID=UPI003F70FED3